MSDFKHRCAKGAELQDELISFLDFAGVEYLKSGYEHLLGSNKAMQIIKNNHDSVSLFIRHYPDVSVIKPDKSVLIEVKNSTGIEKECFNAYMSLQKNLGLIVLLFLKNRMLCRVQDLKFKPMPLIDPVTGIEIPVTDGVWREPRQMDSYKYHQYIEGYRKSKKYTSGCSFAFIDFQCTKFYPLDTIAQSLKAA